MKQQEIFLRPDAVIKQLNISYATLLRRVKKNEIPYIKIGAQLRFPSSYIQSLHHEVEIGKEPVDE